MLEDDAIEIGMDGPPDMELDDIAEQANEVGFLTPREYAKLRGLNPQLVYYYIRTKKITPELCKCGRKVIEVKLADEALKDSRAVKDDLAAHYKIDTRTDEERETNV